MTWAIASRVLSRGPTERPSPFLTGLADGRARSWKDGPVDESGAEILAVATNNVGASARRFA